MPRYPPEIREKAIELAKKGLTYRQVSEKLGCNPRTVGYWCRKAGVKKIARYPKETIEKAVELVKKGLSYSQTAKKLGMSQTAIIRWCLKAGICSKHPRGGSGYPLEFKEKAIEMVKEGLSYTQAASKLGVSRSAVIEWCRERGVKSHVRRVPTYPMETVEKAIEMVKEGFTYEETARKLGVHFLTVRRWCIKSGVKPIFRGGSIRYVQKMVVDGVHYKVTPKYLGLRRLWKVIGELSDIRKQLSSQVSLWRRMGWETEWSKIIRDLDSKIEELKEMAEPLEKELKIHPRRFLKIIKVEQGRGE